MKRKYEFTIKELQIENQNIKKQMEIQQDNMANTDPNQNQLSVVPTQAISTEKDEQIRQFELTDKQQKDEIKRLVD